MKEMSIWEYVKGTILIFAIPVAIFYGARWNPFIGLDEEGYPRHLGVYFVLIPYWVLLYFLWKYRESSKERARDIAVLVSKYFSENEKELVARKYRAINSEVVWGEDENAPGLLKDCPELAQEILRRKNRK